MPFTPFHMGVGLAVKAVAGTSFSLSVFGFTQVMMDVQPLVHLLRGEGVWHGMSHSYLGGTLIALLSAIVGRPLCQGLLRLWKPRPEDRFMTWLHGPSSHIPWSSAYLGAFVGAYTHVFLDSLMHADVEPYAPFAAGNPMAEGLAFWTMHLLCVGIGVLGMIGLAIRYMVDHPPRS